jgi:hypothetical protein
MVGWNPPEGRYDSKPEKGRGISRSVLTSTVFGSSVEIDLDARRIPQSVSSLVPAPQAYRAEDNNG